MFAIYFNCKAILPMSKLAVTHASKGPLRLKAIVVALSIHSFWLFRGLDNGSNLGVNGCDGDSLIMRRAVSPRMSLPYWRGLLLGFVVYLRLATIEAGSYSTALLTGRLEVGEVGARIFGLPWGLAAVGFVVAAVAVFAQLPWWTFTLWVALLSLMVTV
jgi:hypothetical protein